MDVVGDEGPNPNLEGTEDPIGPSLAKLDIPLLSKEEGSVVSIARMGGDSGCLPSICGDPYGMFL